MAFNDVSRYALRARGDSNPINVAVPRELHARVVAFCDSRNVRLVSVVAVALAEFLERQTPREISEPLRLTHSK